MTQRLYLDTSVFGGFFDEEFSKHTIPLFERIENLELMALYSEITLEELESAPLKVKNLAAVLNSVNSEFLVVSEEIIDLARTYISENVVGKTSFADCLHIAVATVNRADFLVSWNFKHIVNINRIRGYNSVNLKFGYKQLEIRSPENLRDMKTTEKSFDAVKFMREERDKITKELVNLSDREILEYFEKKRSQKTQKA